MADEPPKPQLTVVVAANGSGKTTWAQQSRAFLPKPFYNADSIAEGLGDPNNTTLQEQARRIVDQAIEDDLVRQRSFGFESTYSGRSRPNIVIRAKQLGTLRSHSAATPHTAAIAMALCPSTASTGLPGVRSPGASSVAGPSGTAP